MPSGRVEYSNPLHREKSFKDNEARACGRFNETEVRSILVRGKLHDLRQVGCPDSIFEHILEERARKLGVEPADTLSTRIAENKIF